MMEFPATQPLSPPASSQELQEPLQARHIPALLNAQNGMPKLLVVDDQPLNIQALYQIFSPDHEIFMATTGDDALALCRQNPPDLILLDIVMEGMDGLEVCRELKADAATRDIPIIFVTATNDETQALEAGAVDFIVKPVNPAIVRARVRAHLSLKFQADLLQRMAFVDGMTGVANRRYFDERLEREWRRCARAQVSLGLIMFDVDYFKRYNDFYGHQAGDDCLRQIAGALRERTGRPADLIARYGGEEFVCLLPDTDLLGVQYMCETLRTMVANLELPHAHSEAAPCVTISLGGTVCVPDAASGASLLLRHADRLLYRAKGDGRNRAVVEEIPMSAVQKPAVHVEARGGEGVPQHAGTSQEAMARILTLARLLAEHDAEGLELYEQHRADFLSELSADMAERFSHAMQNCDFDAALDCLSRAGLAPARIDASVRGNGRRPTVLVVDDGPEMLSLLVVLLRDRYRVLVANSGEKCLQLLDQRSLPDLVLLDVHMPGIDGKEVCRRMKANRRTANIPVLFLTARSDIADEQAGFALGAADYISKPVSPPILLARVQAQLDLAQRLGYLKQLLHYASDVIIVVDEAGEIVDANDRVRDMYGWTPSQIEGRALVELLPSSWREAWQQNLERLGQLDNIVFESRHRRADGSEFPVEVNIRPVNLPQGRPLHLAIVRDVSERLRVREQLMVDAMIFAQSTESIMVTDSRLRIVSVNQAFTRITGYASTEAVGRRADFVAAAGCDEQRFAAIEKALAADGRWAGEVYNQRRNGETYYEQQAITPVQDSGKILTHYIVTGIDISARKELEQRFQRLSNYDVVTDLPNQFFLRDQLEKVLEEARNTGGMVGVLNVNLERFRTVNEGFGHAVGDEVLRITARRLAGALGADDMVSRLGADNFVCILTRLESAEHASAQADRLLKTISTPIHLGDQHITLAARVGIAVSPRDGESGDILLRNADIAAALGKGSIGGTYLHFNQDHGAEMQHSRKIEQGLRDALKNGELLLHYQPKVSLANGEMTGAEALLRWEHPVRGMLAPGVFIPVAEQSGQIVAIGEWVLHEACLQARRWQEQGIPAFPVSVNVSALQFHKGDLLDVVKSALTRSGLAPELLELEVTESVLTADIEKTTTLLNQIRQLGVLLSIDDFGTGYSSLSYLKSFPITTLKIDRSFVHDIASGPTGESIIRGITALGHSLQLSIIAEGVEDQAQANFLRTIGCDHIQGYLFSRPLPAEQLIALLKEWRKLPEG